MFSLISESSNLLRSVSNLARQVSNWTQKWDEINILEFFPLRLIYVNWHNQETWLENNLKPFKIWHHVLEESFRFQYFANNCLKLIQILLNGLISVPVRRSHPRRVLDCGAITGHLNHPRISTDGSACAGFAKEATDSSGDGTSRLFYTTNCNGPI